MLVCHFFPPQNSIGARRPYSWFRQWTESGHEVSVLTTRKTAIDGPFEDFVPGAAFKERVVEVDYQGAWAGFMGAIMAPRRPVAAAASARPASTPPLKRVLRKVRSSLLANYGEPRSAWTRRAIAKGEEIVRGRGIEVIVSSSPPYMCHSVAAALKARFPRLLWVADFRDLWSGSHIHRGARVVEAIERVHERRTLAGADLLLTVSEPLAAHLRSLHRKPVEVVPNGIERETLEG
ncbi:MAG: glycosyltransferase, partial [Usitatibacter sp.]